jgi:hypothetical protein
MRPAQIKMPAVSVANGTYEQKRGGTTSSCVSCMRTRRGSHTQFGPVTVGVHIGAKMVASMRQNEQGKWWATYYDDNAKSDDEVADEGARLPRAG